MRNSDINDYGNSDDDKLINSNNNKNSRELINT